MPRKVTRKKEAEKQKIARKQHPSTSFLSKIQIKILKILLGRSFVEL